MLVSVTLLGIVMVHSRSSGRPGPSVDQLIEHGVDRGEHARGRLVTALIGEQVGHFLVEVDPGLRFTGHVDLVAYGILDLAAASRRLRRYAEPADHGLVGGVRAGGGVTDVGERVGRRCGRGPAWVGSLGSPREKATWSGVVIATAMVAAVVPVKKSPPGVPSIV
jgi:hypothetical protein